MTGVFVRREDYGLGGGREVQEGGDICMPMVDSCWYVAGTTIL